MKTARQVPSGVKGSTCTTHKLHVEINYAMQPAYEPTYFSRIGDHRNASNIFAAEVLHPFLVKFCFADIEHFYEHLMII